MASFHDLLTSNVGSALAKQFAFGDSIKAEGYRLNLEEGLLELDTGQAFPVQLLGYEDYRSGTWTWAWSGRDEAVHSSLLEAADTLKERGKAEAIDEFSSATFSLSIADGHKVSMVASQLCDADCYFRIPSEHGATYLLLSNTPICERRELNPLRIIQVIEKALELYKFNQEKMISAFLEQQGYSVTKKDDWYMVLMGSDRVASMRFSPEGKMLEYRSKFSG